MSNEALAIAAIALTGASGVPGACLGRSSRWGERIATALILLGSAIGLAAAAGALLLPDPGLRARWAVPGGEIVLVIDGLSAFFLFPIFLIPALGSVYGLAYWSQAEHAGNGRSLRLFYGVLTAALALLVIARNAVLFLAGWEVMAIAAFLLIATEDHEPAVRRASYVYLIATRMSTLALFAMFAVVQRATGSLEFPPPAPGLAGGAATAAFVLALVGFGLKAGAMPLHLWLPGAHANAPSHVSALMSGVLIKVGIYGLLRFTTVVDSPPEWWGGTVLGLGVVSGVLGVARALGQHDLKRLLAYHSVENIGIILIGVGLALLGRAHGRADLMLLGVTGALLHVWNHGLFKALLFLGAGTVVHATGTREIDRLGGLSKRMPRAALLFLVGAVAICGLPPLNGFISELLVYVGLLRAASTGAGAVFLAGALAAPALALIGGLAVACFVKVLGAVYLGEARSADAERAREVPPAMLAPMAAIAACCLLIGVASPLVAPALDRAAGAWAPRGAALPALAATAPLAAVSAAALALLAVLAALAAALAGRTRRSRAAAAAVGTWDCGYAAPTARMQYTASSFADGLVDRFSWALRPQAHRPDLRGAPFPVAAARFESHVPEVLLDRGLAPALRLAGRLADGARRIRRGNVHSYLLSILIGLLALLVLAQLEGRRVIADLVIHVALLLFLPPLLAGVITKTKAVFAGRVGPPLLQPYHDLTKLLRKDSVFSRTTTWVFRAGPVVGLGSTFLAGLLLPLGGHASPLSFAGDLVLFAYLFALGRFFTVAAALDTGSAFEGMGGAREATFSCLAEPALFFGMLVLVRSTGSLTLSGMLGPGLAPAWSHAAASLVLVVVSLFVVLLAETSRIPFDDPSTHLELTMIHEVMVLDHGGPVLAMIHHGAAMKLLVLGALVTRIVLPYHGGGAAAWVLFVAGMLLLAVLIGVIESVMARLRLVQIPILLVAACLLAGFGVVLLAR